MAEDSLIVNAEQACRIQQVIILSSFYYGRRTRWAGILSIRSIRVSKLRRDGNHVSAALSAKITIWQMIVLYKSKLDRCFVQISTLGFEKLSMLPVFL
jgi:hypothetical protein